MSKVNARKNDILGEEELEEAYDELEGEEYDDEDYGDEPDEEVSKASGSQVVVSDSRARRKRNRGEAFETVAPGSATTEKKNRPTPSRRDAKVTTGNRIENLPVIGRLVTYFRNVYTEMQKVTWPTREETIRLTRIVLSVTVGFSLALGALDIFYSWWMHNELLNNTGGFLAIAAIFVALLGVTSWYLFYRKDEALPY